MAERDDPDGPEVVIGQVAQELVIDAVGAEVLGVSAKTNPAQPTVDVQSPVPWLVTAEALKNIGVRQDSKGDF